MKGPVLDWLSEGHKLSPSVEVTVFSSKELYQQCLSTGYFQELT